MKHPCSRKIVSFEQVDVRILKELKLKRKTFKVGSILKVQLIPDGYLYIVSGLYALNRDAIEGVDFEFV